MKALPRMPKLPARKDVPAPAAAVRSPIRPAMVLERKHTSAGGRETRSFALQIRAVGDDGTVEGYGSVFGVRDSYDDVIAPGAYAASLAAHKADGTMPAMLWQHDQCTPIGVWTEMTEDSKGLKIKGQLALDTEKGAEAYALLKMKALNGLSIGFIAQEWKYDNENDIRTLTKVDLWEVSLVTFPANEKARVTGVKSSNEISAPKDAERILRDAGFSKSDATAFVSRVMRMGEERRDSADSTAEALKATERLLKSLTTS